MSRSTPSDFDKVFKDLMSVVDKTRAAAEKSAKRGVGPRGPVSGGKEFVIPFVDKQNNGKKVREYDAPPNPPASTMKVNLFSLDNCRSASEARP